jgi:putative SOS response-associated peptidase YedK
MCGRFALYQPERELQERFNALVGDVPLEARYNIAQTQPIAVVREQEGHRRLKALTWGLAPHWAKKPLINIRAETLTDPSKSYFQGALARRRCIIPASGFYEWREADNPAEGGKTPIFFRPADGSVLGFAGVWDGETCAIVTTEPNALAGMVHDRMPVILPREVEGEWLDTGLTDAEALRSLLVPYGGGLEAYPVGRGVNRPGNDGPELIVPEGASLAVSEQ